MLRDDISWWARHPEVECSRVQSVWVASTSGWSVEGGRTTRQAKDHACHPCPGGGAESDSDGFFRALARRKAMTTSHWLGRPRQAFEFGNGTIILVIGPLDLCQGKHLWNITIFKFEVVLVHHLKHYWNAYANIFYEPYILTFKSSGNIRNIDSCFLNCSHRSI